MFFFFWPSHLTAVNCTADGASGFLHHLASFLSSWYATSNSCVETGTVNLKVKLIPYFLETVLPARSQCRSQTQLSWLGQRRVDTLDKSLVYCRDTNGGWQQSTLSMDEWELQSNPRENLNCNPQKPESETNPQPSYREVTLTQSSSATLEPKGLPTGSVHWATPLRNESLGTCSVFFWNDPPNQTGRIQTQPCWTFQNDRFALSPAQQDFQHPKISICILGQLLLCFF